MKLVVVSIAAFSWVAAENISAGQDAMASGSLAQMAVPIRQSDVGKAC